MDIKDLIERLNQHIHLMKSELNNSMQLKNDIEFSIKSSDEKLIAALVRKPQNSDEIAKIMEKLENDRRLYANCELCIIKYQADIITKELEIERLEQRLKETINKKSSFNFYSKKDDPDNDKYQASNNACQYSSTWR